MAQKKRKPSPSAAVHFEQRLGAQLPARGEHSGQSIGSRASAIIFLSESDVQFAISADDRNGHR